jgi:hypothetical protein
MNAANHRERRVALAQGLSIVAGLAGASMVAAWIARAPADAAKLRIPLAEFRSQAAELALLEREAGAGHAGRMFARAHTEQLAKSIRRTFNALCSLDVAPELVVIQQAGIADGRELIGPAVTLEQAERVRDRLGSLERSLRR